MFRLFLFTIFLFIVSSIVASVDSIDLKINNLSDTEKISHLLDEANKFQYSDLKKYYLYSEKARQIALSINDVSGTARSTLKVGYYFLDISDFDNALSYFLEALRLNEKIGDKKGIANSLFSLGNIYYYLDEPETALKYYGKSFPIYTELKDIHGLALVSNTIGVIYMDQKQYTHSLQYFNSALKYYEDLNNRLLQGQVLTNMSVVFMMTKDFVKALSSARKGVEIARNLDDKIGVAKGLVNIAEIHNENNEWTIAKANFEQALTIAFEEKDKNLIRIIYEDLSLMSKKQGNYKQALSYYEQGIKVKDSIFSSETTNQILELQTKYETDKKEKEIQLLVKDQERNKVIRAAFISGLSLLALLSFYVYRNYRIKRKANEILITKNGIIEEKNKNIQDSINYAKRIQEAILPATEEIASCFSDYFILYKPKDVVSGDFYAFAKKGDKVILAAVDCTGHGVPGAFMSMIGTDKINHIVIEQGITTPSEILNQLNRGIKTALKQRETEAGESRDGMDLALCSFDLKGSKLEYAGAHRPLYHINGQLNIIDPDKMAIGGWTEDSFRFRNNEIDLKKGDCIYMFSDGYADQFGGPRQKKFTTKRFKELLLSVCDRSMSEQKQALDSNIEEWRGDLEQIDDILVIGVRI